MKNESNKFPAVMTTQSIFGLDEGTVLKFDWASGKYVSISEEEDIAEDYFYSGYALALDPYLVKDNIGTYFTFIEQAETKEEIPETSKDEVIEALTNVDPKSEDLKEAEKETLPEYTKSHNLVVDCDCGYRHFLWTIQAPGVQFTIMAEDETSFVEYTCPECGSSMKIWFAPSKEYVGDEPSKEESN